MVDKKQDLSLVSYTLGIVSVVMAFLGDLGIAGIVFGVIGLNLSKHQKNDLSKKARKLNIIGLTIGIVIFVVSLILLYFFAPQIA